MKKPSERIKEILKQQPTYKWDFEEAVMQYLDEEWEKRDKTFTDLWVETIKKDNPMLQDQNKQLNQCEGCQKGLPI